MEFEGFGCGAAYCSGVSSSFGVRFWNFPTVAPDSLASVRSSFATSISPLWLQPISAMTNGSLYSKACKAERSLVLALVVAADLCNDKWFLVLKSLQGREVAGLGLLGCGLSRHHLKEVSVRVTCRGALSAAEALSL